MVRQAETCNRRQKITGGQPSKAHPFFAKGDAKKDRNLTGKAIYLGQDSLRHTNASLLISQGVDVRTVASLLGHTQASTTLDIYAHAFDKNKRKAQEKLGKAIGL